MWCCNRGGDEEELLDGVLLKRIGSSRDFVKSLRCRELIFSLLHSECDVADYGSYCMVARQSKYGFGMVLISVPHAAKHFNRVSRVEAS